MLVVELPSLSSQAVDCTLVTSQKLSKQVAAVLESAGAEHRVISDKDLRRLSAEMSLLLIHVNSKDPQMCRVWFSPFWVDSWELYS